MRAFFENFKDFFLCFCVISTAPVKSKSKKLVYHFLTRESASVVCVSANSQKVEMSMRSEWSFHTFPALFQDFVVLVLVQVQVLVQVLVLALALALAPVLDLSLVPLGTSHRLALPLWVEQSPCGSWDTGKGIRSCHKPVGWCCPAGHSLQGILRVTEELD